MLPGFILNLKSELTPTQDRVYIRVDSGQIWAESPYQERRAGALLILVKSFSNVGLQTGPPVSEPTGPDGSHTTGSGICPHTYTHATHPVVPGAALDLHHIRVAPSYLYTTGAYPGSEVLVRQVQPVLGNAIQVSHAHHYYNHGCKHGRLGKPLHGARVRSCTIQQNVNEPEMPAPHQCVRVLDSSSDTPSGAGALSQSDSNKG